jgi:hypothetical protein
MHSDPGRLPTMTEIFPIAPAPLRSLWLIGTILVIVLGVAWFLGRGALGSRTTQFTLTPAAGLEVRGPYGRTIPWDAMKVEEARRTHLDSDSSLRPTLRTNGIGLRGYRAGWFRLSDGSRGLLFVTDPSRAVAIPTSEGFTVIVSPVDPDAFLATLQREGR